MLTKHCILGGVSVIDRVGPSIVIETFHSQEDPCFRLCVNDYAGNQGFNTRFASSEHRHLARRAGPEQTAQDTVVPGAR